MPTPKPKFVEVIWHDANAQADWSEFKDLPAPTEVVSRGWLVKKTKEYVVLSASLSLNAPKADTYEFGETIAIPMGMVEKIRKLKV